MEKIKAKIVADSINQQGDRITTYLLTFPRFILAELNTHRVFSKNSASSRAIPFEKIVKMVEEDPFIPIAWQSKHSGMQGTEYLDGESEQKLLVNKWLEARDLAVQQSKLLNNSNVTKQLCNRLLEPFMWHTVLLTATEFENFFELRCPKYIFGKATSKPKIWKSKKDAIKDFPHWETNNDLFWRTMNYSQAEIHMQALAEAMWDAYNKSTPKQLNPGEWHIPFGDKINDKHFTIFKIKLWENKQAPTNGHNRLIIKIATARAARLSYMTFDGKVDYEKDIKLHDTLLESQHMSPFEHCARAMTDLEYYSFIKGKVPTQKDEYGILNYEYYPYFNGKTNRDGEFWMGFNGVNPNNGNRFGWCRNFKGFIQYRYLIENHYDGFRI